MAEVHVIDVSPGPLRGYISAFVIVDEKVTIVDPGPETGYEKLNAWLREKGLKPDIVVTTHVHLDHAGAAAHLLRDYPGSMAYVHPRGVQHVVDPSKLYQASTQLAPLLPQTYGRPLEADASRVLAAQDGQRIALGRSSLLVMHTPGHASHHMSLLLEPNGILFTGDSAGVIFAFGGQTFKLPTTPPPFKPKMYLESIDKMMVHGASKMAPTHFGIHDDAQGLLREAKEQAALWLDVIARAGPSASLDRLEAELAKADDNVARLLSLRNEEFALRGFLDTTVQGLAEAVRAGEWP